MEQKHKLFYILLITVTLAVISTVTFFYIRQLNRTISDNIVNLISEIAEHDKSTIQTYIEICWEDLREISQRFKSYDCKTVADIEAKMSLEQDSGKFDHIYLLAEDGAIYTDDHTVVCAPGADTLNREADFLSYFADGEENVVMRYDSTTADGEPAAESLLYGVRLKNFEVDGTKMLAIIGISDISSIQNHMVIDSFFKDGKSRGHSALIDVNGNYIVNINKEIYLNEQNNLFAHLSESESSELTNEEVALRLAASETFGFYHSHTGEKYKELFYFIPFKDEFDLYFIMSVNEEVFMEQSRTFVTMSMAMLTVCMTAVVCMLLVVMWYQNKTIRASEKAKSQKEFLSNMSHEIRTPLNGLIGINHLIMSHIDNDNQKSQIKEWLKKSHSTANYLLSLVNDILDISKLQAGKVDLFNEPLLVSELVDEIAAMQADNIQSRGVEFIVEKDITVPCVEGDATRIKQILMNIVGNAAKFTPKGNHIRLSVSQTQTDDTHVTTVYRCEDTGIGISREYIDQIFDSFSQEKNRHVRGIKGTGLGMAISKLLANAMGGDITVQSELNVGSTFTVTLPSLIVEDLPDYMRDEERSSDTDNGDNPRANRDQCRPIKILVAEDVELNAEILLEILDLEGFETAHAENGQEAVELFRQSEPGEFNIILMDMQMPVMDGCAAAREIRKMDRADAKSVFIYACTANTFLEDRNMALESGMDDFLTKPIDVNILLKKIESSVKPS